MKKSTLKIVGLLALLTLGAGLAYHRYGKKTATNSAAPSSSASTMVKGVTPSEFNVPSPSNDPNFYTKYWSDGKTFYKQSMGPNLKSAPVSISEADFIKDYSAWKA